MTRLILLNGPPGIGKSTIGIRYATAHPLAFCLDVDLVRRSIGGWMDHPAQSGLLARKMALAMVAEHLQGGFDVVVPQYLARPSFIHELEQVAARTGSSFHEIVLMDSRDQAIRRFHRRADDPELAAHHRDAAAMLGAEGGLDDMYDRLLTLLESRRAAHVVQTRAGDVEGTYRAVLDQLDGPARPTSHLR